MFEKEIEKFKNEIILKTQELIRIPSVYQESNHPYKPFGENISDALEYMLDLGKALGFRTKNIDGYCGYIEFGEGDELLGIIGHLDVVPEGENWVHSPFSAIIDDEKIYGRGAIDDKGPVISSLYAMKIVSDYCKSNNLRLNKRVRLILGLNEERDWKCIEYYKQHEELPTIGFSPDSDFPCIYAEKSVLSCYLKADYSNYLNYDIIIKSIDCNNNAINVVPKICSTILKINTNKIQMEEFIFNIKTILKDYNFEIDLYKINDEELKLTSYGIQAHSAHPDLGINSISRLIVVLDKIFKKYNINISLFDFFSKYINLEYYGKNLAINFKDESGNLTLNVGNFALENINNSNDINNINDANSTNNANSASNINTLKIGLNLRVPVKTPISDIENRFLELLTRYPNIEYETVRYQKPLYIPKDNYLVKTLCKIYNEETNSNLEPIAIGGATFARAFDNCVCFGANLPNQKDMCHQTDEFITIHNLLLSCQIFARAIWDLGTTPKSSHFQGYFSQK